MKVVANHKGFTLVEIMTTLAIFGVILTAMYGVYISMNRTSVNQQGVIDIQQNLRLALDAIGQDIKMAGALIPKDANPVTVATATALTLQTASSFYTFATVSADQEIAASPGATTGIDFAISMPSMVDNFTDDDPVRLIRPQSGEQPFNAELTVVEGDRAIPSITLKGFTNPDAVQYKAGDLLVRVVAGATNPATVVWARNGSELRRNGGGGFDPVADNISDIEFTYLLDDDTESTTPAGSQLGNIRAVRVRLTGTADNQVDGQVRTRTLESTFYLRNINL